MQDWLTDDPMNFLRSMKTATQLHPEDFTTCTTCEQQPWFSFFFDGTSNNRKLDKPKQKLSNIARLFEGHAEERPLIRRFYYPGVGTPLDESDPSWWEKIRDSEMLGGGAGLGSDVRLVKAEGEFNLALRRNNHKVSRIDIAVFGFSRGATLARAFVNRLLNKCTMRHGVPHWPCPTAVDGDSAPLHFRFLGVFDTVESVGLPAHNLSAMRMQVPAQVEKASGTLEQQLFAHMRLYYGWLKARFGRKPSEIYRGVASTDPEIEAQLERIGRFHESMKIDIDTMNWRAHLTNLWNTDRNEYDRVVETAGGDRPLNRRLSDEQQAYWQAWLNPPTLSPNLLRFFDQYVHDSRAGFLRIDSSGYLRPRQIIDVESARVVMAPSEAAPMAGTQTAGSPQFAFSG